MNKVDRTEQDQQFVEKLSNFLKVKKCLVILDDIWSIDAWNSLKPAFQLRESNSKILLTSRNKEVALHVDAKGYLYELPFLTYEESCELFQKVAFPKRDSLAYNVDLYGEELKKKELGNGMVKHCGGLPLAIIGLGGILAKKCSIKEWDMVSKNVKSYLKRVESQVTEHVLALSYYDLPPYLRPCFVYLSHFPTDYEINGETLIQSWVAEGIVSSKLDDVNGGEVLEDVVECYLIELAERCMIQVGKRDVTLKIKTCRMHDLMRDLCLSKAKQENFLYTIDHSNSNQITRNFFQSITSKVRRVVAHEGTLVQRIKSSHLRSILFFADPFEDDVIGEGFLNAKMQKYSEEHEDEICNPSVFVLGVFLLCKVHGSWTYMFKNFKLLRVLHFEGAEFGYFEGGWKLPSTIDNLIHLRFLSLTCFKFDSPKFPSSLGNLKCLQTLNLRVPYPVHVPNVIWKLEELRHLYLPERRDDKTKLRLHTLKKLQTLVNFNTWNCFIEDLFSMLNLKDLKSLRVRIRNSKASAFGPYVFKVVKE